MTRFLRLDSNGKQHLAKAIAFSSGVSDGDKIVATDSTGKINSSLLPANGQSQGAGKSLLLGEVVFYVRNGGTGDGTSLDNAFDSVETALTVLSSQYEVQDHLIIDLDLDHSLNCTRFPQFTGAGKITIRSSASNTNITFVGFEGNTVASLYNWSALDINLENLTFIKGDLTLLNIEGGKINLNGVDFSNCEVQFESCRTTNLDNCQNSHRIRFYRSNLNLTACSFTAEFFYSQVYTINCQFNRLFLADACQILLRNPRFNYNWYTVTEKISNSTVEFKASWLTFVNLGGNPQTRNLIEFINCNLKDFPSNVDVQGNRTFFDSAIVKFVNCQTPLEFNNVNYNFSQHIFYGDSCAISLVNTAFLKEINVTGGEIKLDPFSILGNKNYDNSQTGIPANNLQEAIDYIWNNLP